MVVDEIVQHDADHIIHAYLEEQLFGVRQAHDSQEYKILHDTDM